jgi:hypothetical protein
LQRQNRKVSGKQRIYSGEGLFTVGGAVAVTKCRVKMREGCGSGCRFEPVGQYSGASTFES